MHRLLFCPVLDVMEKTFRGSAVPHIRRSPSHHLPHHGDHADLSPKRYRTSDALLLRHDPPMPIEPPAPRRHLIHAWLCTCTDRVNVTIRRYNNSLVDIMQALKEIVILHYENASWTFFDPDNVENRNTYGVQGRSFDIRCDRSIECRSHAVEALFVVIAGSLACDHWVSREMHKV